jgi:hypothetical protein
MTTLKQELYRLERRYQGLARRLAKQSNKERKRGGNNDEAWYASFRYWGESDGFYTAYLDLKRLRISLLKTSGGTK